MESKETVMSDQKMYEIELEFASKRNSIVYYRHYAAKVAEAQAEVTWPIAFKAGIREGIVKSSILHAQASERAALSMRSKWETDAKKAGIREVVEWVNTNIYFTDNQDMPRLFSRWKSFLEEREIE